MQRCESKVLCAWLDWRRDSAFMSLIHVATKARKSNVCDWASFMWRYFLRDAVVLQIRTVSCRFLFVANENFREFSRKIRGNLLVVALAEIPRGVGNVQELVRYFARPWFVFDFSLSTLRYFISHEHIRKLSKSNKVLQQSQTCILRTSWSLIRFCFIGSSSACLRGITLNLRTVDAQIVEKVPSAQEFSKVRSCGLSYAPRLTLRCPKHSPCFDTQAVASFSSFSLFPSRHWSPGGHHTSADDVLGWFSYHLSFTSASAFLGCFAAGWGRRYIIQQVLGSFFSSRFICVGV